MIETLKSYKLPYQVFNFFKKGELDHNVPLYKKYGLDKKYFSSISSADFKNIESPKNIYDAHDSFTEMPKDPAFNSIDEAIQPKLLSWSKNGYVILDGFFSGPEVDSFNKEVSDLIENKKAKFRYKNKIMFAFHDSPILHDLGNNKKLNEILNLLLGKKLLHKQ